MTNRTFYTAKLNLALTIIFLKPLTKCYKNLRRPISHQKPSITAEVSKTFRHWSQFLAVVPNGPRDTSAPVLKCLGSEMSWVRIVRTPLLTFICLSGLSESCWYWLSDVGRKRHELHYTCTD